MNSSQEMITHYEAIAHLAQEMLAATRVGDWSRLAHLEAHCTHHINQLQQHANSAPLTSAIRAQKIHILKQILADDRKIRNLIDPWPDALNDFLEQPCAHWVYAH